jgi:hypothetical protein
MPTCSGLFNWFLELVPTCSGLFNWYLELVPNCSGLFNWLLKLVPTCSGLFNWFLEMVPTCSGLVNWYLEMVPMKEIKILRFNKRPPFQNECFIYILYMVWLNIYDNICRRHKKHSINAVGPLLAHTHLFWIT